MKYIALGTIVINGEDYRRYAPCEIEEYVVMEPDPSDYEDDEYEAELIPIKHWRLLINEESIMDLPLSDETKYPIGWIVDSESFKVIDAIQNYKDIGISCLSKYVDEDQYQRWFLSEIELQKILEKKATHQPV